MDVLNFFPSPASENDGIKGAGQKICYYFFISLNTC